MLRKFLSSRGFVSVTTVTLVAAVTVAAYLVMTTPTVAPRAYCAIMPDATGMSVGNHVTMLGVPVGKVTAMRRDGVGVRMDFTVDAAHPLRGDVKAVSVNDSLASDMQLAVLTAPSGPDLGPGTCVTKTMTPKTITETLNAIAGLTGDLAGSGTGSTDLADGLSNLDTATANTGPKLNALIKKIADVLDAPDAAVTHIGDLIDALSSLAAWAVNRWDTLRDFVGRISATMDQINHDVVARVPQLFDLLSVILPWASEVARQYGPALLGGLDASIPYLHRLAGDVPTVAQALRAVPVMADSFRRSVDPVSGALVVTYLPPSLPGPDLATLIFGPEGPR